MTQDMITLGFDLIIEQLQNQAVSQAARRKLAEQTAPICTKASAEPVWKKPQPRFG